MYHVVYLTMLICALNSTVLLSVVSHCHKNAFGEHVAVTEHLHSRATPPPSLVPHDESTGSVATREPAVGRASTLEVCVPPLIAQCLQKYPAIIGELNEEHRVVINGNKIEVTATSLSSYGWQENARKKLELHLSSTFTQKDLEIPREAATDIAVSLSALAAETCIAFSFKDEHTTLTITGTQDAVATVEATVAEIKGKYTLIEESCTLNPREYSFFSEVLSDVFSCD